MGLLLRDSKGLALSLDLLLALIPLTLVLGFVAADMGNLLYQMEDTVFRSSMDRAAGDAVSALMETSGDPFDWETSGNANIVGLAQYDPSSNKSIEGTIDPVKLAAITAPQVQKLVGSNYDFYMNVSIIGSSTPIRTLGNSSFSTATDVVRVQRDTQTSKFKVVSKLVGGQIIFTGGVRNYNPPSFQTNTFSNQTYDYWILIANNSGFKSATVNINNNAITFNNLTNGDNIPIKINSSFLNINGTTLNNNTVIMNATGSFPSSMDFYVVQTPKNTSAAEINSLTVKPQDSNLVLYLWLKS